MKKLVIATAALLSTGTALASDPAQNETAESQRDTVQVHTVNMSGKPPFKRTTETLTVTDAAALEVEEAQQGTDTKGRPPFNRHR